MDQFRGKTAFITGGSSGIGLGMAQAFLEAGAKVIITYRTERHLEEAIATLNASKDRFHAIKVDVTDREGMKNAADEAIRTFGNIHYLINNAGIALHSTPEETTVDEWDLTIDVNINGVFNAIHAFVSHMKVHGEPAHIVTTSSILGLFTIGTQGYSYSMSKFAVVGMMEALRGGLKDTNIGVSVYCPGLVRSKIWDSDRLLTDDDVKVIHKKSAEELEKEIAFRNDLAVAMTEIEAGRILLEGIERGDLYIITHPEYRGILEDRFDLILSSHRERAGISEERIRMADNLRTQGIYK